jgi:hypothetical protein
MRHDIQRSSEEARVNQAGQKLWPFSPRMSLITALILLVVLFSTTAIVRANWNWPGSQSETAVFIGILVLGLLPIGLVLMDLIIDRGAVIEYAGVKLDFSRERASGLVGITVPANIGVPGKPLSDSGSSEILDALDQAVGNEVVVVDLENGQAWWETRLLVLLAGADRLKRPDKIVFVGTDARQPKCFQGWAHPKDLLPQLVKANPQYEWSLEASRAGARQLDLLEPTYVLPGTAAVVPGPAAIPPATLPMGTLAWRHSNMAVRDGVRNELFAEQLLQADLGEKIEMQGGSARVGLARLEELFRSVLYREAIDLDEVPSAQLASALDTTASPSLALTHRGEYVALVPRMALLANILKSVVQQRTRT